MNKSRCLFNFELTGRIAEDTFVMYKKFTCQKINYLLSTIIESRFNYIQMKTKFKEHSKR